MKVTKADGTVVENVYDVDGVLVGMTVNGVATDLLVDTSGGLSHVVAEIDGSGTVTALYVRAGDMLLEEVRGGVAKMYEADGLGSVRSLLDTTGAQTDTWSYEAFGTTLSSTGSDANPYRFAGERYVGNVGMYQNRARWLDTRTGRFVSVDPAEGDEEKPTRFHPYLYGAANPTMYVDASGREFSLTGQVATVAGMASLAATRLHGSLMQAFRTGGPAVAKAFQDFGRLGENTCKRIAEVAAQEVGIIAEFVPRPQVGSRYVDWLVRAGDRVLRIEVKFSVPRVWDQLTRMADQVGQASQRGGETLLWFFREPRGQQLYMLEQALGERGGAVQVEWGFDGLYRYMIMFFSR